jgi:glutamate---cysteine ligase / carboxylate-amine ligase
VVAYRPRFGVEEEFLVVDPVTRYVLPEAATVVSLAAPCLGARVGGEITQCQVETRTDPCHTVDELHQQLTQARAVLAGAASTVGLRVVATGTPVLGDFVPAPITEGPRQDRGNALFRGLHDDLVTCALHVHVEIPEPERAVLVSNHLRPYLPTLIALAANSPHWARKDTGYACWRTMIWSRWPVAGPPPYFRSERDYRDTIAKLRDVGTIVDIGTVFWDIRPSAHVPTLEIRVCDVPITATESAMLAAMVRALVAESLRKVDEGDAGPLVPAELLRMAYWRAARDGIAGHGIDVTTERLVPAAKLAADLLATASPMLEECGDLGRVTGWLRQLLDRGDGATRQRRAATPGGLTAVVDHLISHTADASVGAELGTPAEVRAIIAE